MNNSPLTTVICEILERHTERVKRSFASWLIPIEILRVVTPSAARPRGDAIFINVGAGRMTMGIHTDDSRVELWAGGLKWKSEVFDISNPAFDPADVIQDLMDAIVDVATGRER